MEGRDNQERYILADGGETGLRSDVISLIFLFSFEKNNAISRLIAKVFVPKVSAFILIGHLN
jgi:hypothetical protein